MISRIIVGDAYRKKQEAREALAKNYRVDVNACRGLFEQIQTISYGQIDAAMKRRDLLLEEAFVGMCYVLRATNASFAEATEPFFAGIECSDFRVIGREFLNGMAVKEAWHGVTEEEIAGLVIAAQFDVLAHPSYGDRVIETCGTGGDIGFGPAEKPRKTINLSTLSSLVLASLGVPTTKHGSYANTSAVGSTDAIERFGALVEQNSVEEIERIFSELRYYFSDAHVVKTIHDLSHLAPRHETINHVIGPMTPPVSRVTRLDKVMGVNEKIHPQRVAKAYQLLGERGEQRIGNIAVVSGLDVDIDTHRVTDERFVASHAILDELSPRSSVVAFVREGKYVGTFLLRPEDFGQTFPNGSVELENRAEVLQRENERVLRGQNDRLCAYLAMNAALGLFVAEYLSRDDALDVQHGPNRDLLLTCFRRCRGALEEARPFELLKRYVTATGGTFKSLL